MNRIRNLQKKDGTQFEGFDLRAAQAARSFHRSLPNYAETPLFRLKHLAALLDVNEILVKDEAKRFGIGSFKALGASYAAGRALAARYGMKTADYAAFHTDAMRERLNGIRLVTATDGNHGCGVAWAARLFGCQADVFLPAGSAAERLERIRSYGAEAKICGFGYDDTVRLADRSSKANGGILLQDTAWEGYTEIPRCIMQGYLTMALEAYEALSVPPTHILLQAGVGSMAAAIAAFFAGMFRNPPKLLIVEPSGAACLFESARQGKRCAYAGELHTMMAGLSCGEPSILAWEILSRCADSFLTIEDEDAARGMRRLAFPEAGDPVIEAGESGAAALAALLCLAEDKEARTALELNAASVILCFNTEGATDRANYNRIVFQSHDGKAFS